MSQITWPDKVNGTTPTHNTTVNASDMNEVKAAVNSKLDVLALINTYTANHTIITGDSGAIVRMNVGSANTLTVPLNATLALPVGTTLTVHGIGAGTTTITPESPVVLNGPILTIAQGAKATLTKIAIDTWDVLSSVSSGGSSLPSQAGNAGKFLTTNGSAASWGTVIGVGTALGWINLADYCTGDGIQHYDGSVTSASTTFTSVSASFISGDVGKVIEIVDITGTHATIVRTITAFVDAHTVILSSASPYSGGGRFTYGTDCAPFIQQAINDAQDSESGVLYVPNGVYMLASPPVTSTVQLENPNSLLYIKYDHFQAGYLPSLRRSSISIIGQVAPENNLGDYYSTGDPSFDDVIPAMSGCLFYACYHTAVQSSLSDYPVSILGTKGPSYLGGKNITSVYLRNLKFRVPVDNITKQTIYSGVNMMDCNSLFMDDCNVDSAERVQVLNMSGITAGVICPKLGCSPQQRLNNVSVQGAFLVAVIVGEHSRIVHATLMANYFAIGVPGMQHAWSFDKINVQMAAFAFTRNAYFGLGGGPASVYGGLLDMEANGTAGSGPQTPTAFNYQATINDSLAGMTGHFFYKIVESNTAASLTATVSGSTGLTYTQV